MFQLSIDGKNVGLPMKYEDGCKWQNILAATFKGETVVLKKVVAQYVPVYTLDNKQPALLILGREGFC